MRPRTGIGYNKDMGILKDMISRLFSSGSEAPRPTDLGRNDPCWCGSGRKYKRCHLAEDASRGSAERAACCGKT